MTILNPNDLPAPPAELAATALRVATEAASMVRARRQAGFEVDTKSTTTDMVTDIDRASDTLIRHLLSELRPDDGIITEEDAELAGTSGLVWIADPIDGTTNFVYGHPPYLVSIAATLGGQPVAGAVVEISSGASYHALLGGGSFLNDSPLTIPNPPALSHALIATGFGYDPQRRIRQAAVISKIIGEVRDIRRLGAAAHDLCSVASGRVDAYYEHGLGPWDLAAGQLIVTEAGGAVEGIEGGEAHANLGVIAAHRDLIGPLRELLMRSGVSDVLG